MLNQFAPSEVMQISQIMLTEQIQRHRCLPET